jgi:hypothetical protein
MRPQTILAALLTPLLFLATGRAHPGSGIFVDTQGQVYFVDTGSGLWKIDTQGRLTKLPGSAFHWFALDTSNRFQDARMPSGPGWEIRVAGRAPTLVLSSDYPIAIAPDGNAYFPLPGPGRRLRLMRLTPDGRQSVFAELPPETAGWLNGLTAAPDGSLYYTEAKRIRRVDARGRVTTIAAEVRLPACARIPDRESGQGVNLRGLAVESAGHVYVAANGCGSLLKVAPEGRTTVVLQLDAPWSPTAVAVSGGALYVLEYRHTASDDRREWMPRVRKITSDGKSVILASLDRR